MHKEQLSLLVEKGHPAYEWAKKQSDSVSAFGHIGTHIDCYESEPAQAKYEVEAVVVDCTDSMPLISDFEHLDISGKALVMFTGNVEQNGYGTSDYGAMDTSISTDVVDLILQKTPAFIVIDSYGIGSHGDEHIRFDKRCESKGCFVIENVNLSKAVIGKINKLQIEFDKSSQSTGKRCEITALCI
jgi:kynurenine formamidase